jgi:hypothetical protein
MHRDISDPNFVFCTETRSEDLGRVMITTIHLTINDVNLFIRQVLHISISPNLCQCISVPLSRMGSLRKLKITWRLFIAGQLDHWNSCGNPSLESLCFGTTLWCLYPLSSLR